MFNGAFIMVLIVASLAVFNSFRQYNIETAALYENSLQEQQYFVKAEVDNAVFFINNMLKYFKLPNQELKESIESYQNNILNILSTYRFGEDGYLFGSAEDGIPLFSNGKVTKGSAKVWDLTDPDGVKVIQQQLKALENPEGVFVNYSWRKLNEHRPSPKISYSKAIPEWRWIIGAGIYLEDIDDLVIERKNLLYHNLTLDLLLLLIIFTIYIAISYFTMKKISVNFKKNLKALIRFFDNAASNYEPIDLKLLKFYEFNKIAGAANQMIKKQKAAENALASSETQFRLLAENQNDILITTDCRGILKYCSPAIKKLTGYDTQEAIGKSVIQFLANKQDEHILGQATEDIVKSKQARVVEVNVKNAAGNILPIEISINPILVAGKLVYYNAILRDISKRKAIEIEFNTYRLHLEDLVMQRTQELENKNDELKKNNEILSEMNKVFTGREFRIKELRNKVKELEAKLES